MWVPYEVEGRELRGEIDASEGSDLGRGETVFADCGEAVGG